MKNFQYNMAEKKNTDKHPIRQVRHQDKRGGLVR